MCQIEHGVSVGHDLYHGVTASKIDLCQNKTACVSGGAGGCHKNNKRRQIRSTKQNDDERGEEIT